ncbi:MAG: adaptor protein MecA [Clostridia bacterium]|nr:adaptor protein MecA [Clostridia bacterium]
MDVLKISDSKIKIMLTASEASRFGFDDGKADSNDEDARARIFSVLDEVERQSGFSHTGHKLLIQLYRSKDGSAEIFVTRLGAIGGKNERAITAAQEVTVLESKRMLYKFDGLSDLIPAAKSIVGKKCIQESELYYSERDGYYLEIVGRGGSRPGGISELAVLYEYSTRISGELIPYIKEHCARLTDGNALAKLARL